MRLILLIILVVVALSCQASEITCYSKSKMIYRGQGTAVSFHEEYIGFLETATNHLVLINADCIVSIPAKEFHDAVEKRKVEESNQ